MKLTDFGDKSVLILGLGVEGLSTYRLLRELFPRRRLGVADQRVFDELSGEGRELLTSDPDVRLHLGADYLSALTQYDVIAKSPGISPALPPIQDALRQGKILTSNTDIFFSNCPSRIVGVTGTKGKGTTSKLIHAMLKAAGYDAYLVGNIGTSPLSLLKQAKKESVFVYELSAQQLEGLTQSPHIAVCLNIVPDHLDHFGTFENYLSAKQNITLHQGADDYLVYNASFPAPREVAAKSKGRRVPYSVDAEADSRCFVGDEAIIFSDGARRRERVVSVSDVAVTLPGAFNLHNVLPAIAVAKLLRVETRHIVEAIKHFEPLKNRFENVGTYRDITFYNASIATVPEVTIEHLKALGDDVQTMLLGGFDRGIDFSRLGECVVRSNVSNLILFPATGGRIWQAVAEAAERLGVARLPRRFTIEETSATRAMEEAVSIAYRNTSPGKICLHSPASPSFGLFRDFKERGELFKEYVSKIGSAYGDEYWEYDLTGEE